MGLLNLLEVVRQVQTTQQDVRVLHRKRVCHVHCLRQIRERSPPPAKALARSRWEQLPPASRHRLLHLLGRLVERQLCQQAPLLLADREEAVHDHHC